MYRGTTPTLNLTVAGIDLTAMRCIVTIRRGYHSIHKDSADGDLTMAYANGATTIALTLTQEETLSLPTGSVSVQVRYISVGGVAGTTAAVSLPVREILRNGVIAYE